MVEIGVVGSESVKKSSQSREGRSCPDWVLNFFGSPGATTAVAPALSVTRPEIRPIQQSIVLQFTPCGKQSTCMHQVVGNMT